jgi:hypothetical protein
VKSSVASHRLAGTRSITGTNVLLKYRMAPSGLVIASMLCISSTSGHVQDEAHWNQFAWLRQIGLPNWTAKLDW